MGAMGPQFKKPEKNSMKSFDEYLREARRIYAEQEKQRIGEGAVKTS